jgi:hypothetical protein
MARQSFEHALSQYDPAHRAYLTAVTAEDPYCATLVHFSWAMCCLGYADQGRSLALSAIADARRSGQAATVAFAIGIALLTGLVFGPAEQLAYANELVALRQSTVSTRR